MKGGDKKELVVPPVALTVDSNLLDWATLAICLQQPMPGKPAIITNRRLHRMKCGHFCSYPTDSINYRCCICAATPCCLIALAGMKKGDAVG